MVAALKSVGDIIDLINRQFVATVDQFKVLASHEISEDDLKKYVKLVFKIESTDARRKRVLAGLNGASPDVVEAMNRAVDDDESGSGDKVFGRVEPLFYTGRGNDMKGVEGTWWAAYNAITEYTTHHRGADRERRLESIWTGDGARINQKALTTALQMVGGGGGN